MSSLLNAEWPEMKAVRSAEANLLSHCILQQSWNNNNKSNGNNHSNWEERKHYSCSRDKQQGQEIHKLRIFLKVGGGKRRRVLAARNTWTVLTRLVTIIIICLFLSQDGQLGALVGHHFIHQPSPKHHPPQRTETPRSSPRTLGIFRKPLGHFQTLGVAPTAWAHWCLRTGLCFPVLRTLRGSTVTPVGLCLRRSRKQASGLHKAGKGHRLLVPRPHLSNSGSGAPRPPFTKFSQFLSKRLQKNVG